MITRLRRSRPTIVIQNSMRRSLSILARGLCGAEVLQSCCRSPIQGRRSACRGMSAARRPSVPMAGRMAPNVLTGRQEERSMTTARRRGAEVLGLKVGDLVEVRSAEEIRATLDENGELDGLPFMPEMLAFCGRRLTVHKVAHKLVRQHQPDGHAAHVRRGAPHGVALRRLGARWLRERLLAVLEGAVAQACRPRRPGPADAGRRTAHAPPAADGEDAEGAVRGRRDPLLLPGDRDAPGGAAAAAPQGADPVPRGRRVGQRRRPGGGHVVPGRRASTATRTAASGSCPGSSGSGAACAGAS